MVETIDSDRLATALDSAWRKAVKDAAESNRLKVMVQVNTSNEEGLSFTFHCYFIIFILTLCNDCISPYPEKNGVKPEDAPELAKHIVDNCPGLNLVGMMTIGRFGYCLLYTSPSPRD